MEKCSDNLEKSGSKIGQVNQQLRRSYDANFKMMVINEAESSNNYKAAEKYGVSECNVRRWRAQKDCLKNAHSQRKAFRGPRSGRFHELERRVSAYVIEKRKDGMPIGRAVIQLKAMEIAKELNIPTADFKASLGWCNSMMRRHGIRLRRRASRAHRLSSDFGEKPDVLEEADITTLSPTSVHVTSEDDQEEALSSQHQRQTEESGQEPDEEDCGGSGPVNIFHPHRHLQTKNDDAASDSSDWDTNDSDFWKETRPHHSSLNFVKNDVSGSSKTIENGKLPNISKSGEEILNGSRTTGLLRREKLLNSSLSDAQCSQRENCKVWTGKEPETNQKNPEPPQVKEEPQEFLISYGRQEGDIKILSSPVPVESEDDEEDAQSSQLQKNTEETDGEDCGGSEPGKHPDQLLKPDNLTAVVSCKSDDSADSDFYNDTYKDKMKTQDFPVKCKMNYLCDECGKLFGNKSKFEKHMRVHVRERPFYCSVCGEKFMRKSHVDDHMKCHIRWFVERHMVAHTGENQDDPEPPHIKEEQEEMLIKEETDVARVPSTPVLVKSEDNEEKAQSLRRHHSQPEENGQEPDKEDCGRSEPSSTFHPHSQTQTNEHTDESSDCDTDDSDVWKKTTQLQRNEVFTDHRTSASINKLPNFSKKEADLTKFPFTSVTVKSEDDEAQSSQLHQRQTENNRRETDGEHCEDQLMMQTSETYMTQMCHPLCKGGGTRRNEEELCRTKEENQRQKRIPKSVWNPKVSIHPAGSPVDVQQPSGVREEVPAEQEGWSLNLDQEEPEPPHIKEEQEALWTNQQADIINVPPTPVFVKSEDEDEEEAQSSLLLLRQCEEKTKERDEQDMGGSEPNMNQSRIRGFNSQSSRSRRPTCSLQRHMGTRTETRLVDSKCLAAFWQQSNTPRDELMSKNVALSDVKCELRPFQCSDCGKTFGKKANLTNHRRIHTRVRQFDCSVCGKVFGRRTSLNHHMKIHAVEKSFSCPVCQKRFRYKCTMQVHMTTHTGVRAFACAECDWKFSQKSHLVKHMKRHRRKNPVSSTVCQKFLKQKHHFQMHMNTHREEEMCVDDAHDGIHTTWNSDGDKKE